MGWNLRHRAASGRLSALLLASALLAACGGKPPTDALDAAAAAIEGSELAQRCAEAELNAARNLLERARKASADGDYEAARRYADAAREQAERAERVAEENRERCERRTQPVVTTTTPDDDRTHDPDTAPVEVTDYVFRPVLFPFNESSLSDEARTTLEAHAGYLQRNPALRLRIEGHCDELGSSEYNLMLGERRARSVKAYLERLGVDPERLSVVSYGEEMPAGSDDENRRAEFKPR